MRIYDRGTCEILLWDAGKVEVELHGERLTGRWALFPIGRDGGTDREWMIHRMGAPLDPDAEPMPGRRPADARRRGPAADGRGLGVRGQVGRRARALPLGARPPDAALPPRRRHHRRAIPSSAALGRALHEHQAILDGEIVAFDTSADPPRPSFQALQRRMHVRDERRVRRLAAEVPVTFVIFDLLWLDGHSLMELPYDERRARLAELDLRGTALAGARRGARACGAAATCSRPRPSSDSRASSPSAATRPTSPGAAARRGSRCAGGRPPTW